MTAVAASPAAPEVLYAGTAFGGVFRSNDGGASWGAARRGLPALGVLALAVSPDDPALVYAAVAGPTNQGSLALTTNGGRSWHDASPPAPNSYAYSFAIDPHDHSLLYVTTAWGLYRTHFGETSWTLVWRPAFAPESIAIDPENSSTLYVTLIDEASAGGGVFKSVDRGASWAAANGRGQELAGFGGSNLIFDPATPGTLYVIDLDIHHFREVWKSPDGGGSWIDAGVSGTSLAISTAGTLYLDRRLPLGATDLLKSTDHGVTWQVAPGAPDVVTGVSLAPGTAGIAAALGRLDTVSAVGTVGAGDAGRELVLELGEHGLWRSPDGGETWSAASAGLSAQSVASLAVSTAGTLYLGVLFDQGLGGAGLFRGPAHGQRMRRLTGSGGQQLVIDPLDPLTIYAGSLEQIEQRSRDGGLSWSDVSLPAGSLAIDPTGSATLYTARQAEGPEDRACTVERSRDAGETWTCIQPGFLQGFDALLVDPRRPSILYGFARDGFGSGNGFVARSDDGGASWNAASAGLSGTSGLALAIAAHRRPELYALTDRGLFRSLDRAHSWQLVSTALPAGAGNQSSLIADGRTAPTTLYAGIPGVGVLASSDGGGSWAALGSGLPASIFTGVLALDPALPATLYAATAGEGVFRLDVGGAALREPAWKVWSKSN